MFKFLLKDIIAHDADVALTGCHVKLRHKPIEVARVRFTLPSRIQINGPTSKNLAGKANKMLIRIELSKSINAYDVLGLPIRCGYLSFVQYQVA